MSTEVTDEKEAAFETLRRAGDAAIATAKRAAEFAISNVMDNVIANAEEAAEKVADAMSIVDPKIRITG